MCQEKNTLYFTAPEATFAKVKAGVQAAGGVKNAARFAGFDEGSRTTDY